MTELLKIAGVQMDVALGDIESNLQRMEAHLERAAKAGAALVVFPECALTGYCFESKEEATPYAEPAEGPSAQRLALVCKRLACKRLATHAVFGMLESDGQRLFNSCLLVGPEGLVGAYRKIHLPYLGIDRFTTPGDRPFAVHSVGLLKIGMNICYDAAFPEASRVMSLAGADLIVLPTNWPPGAECMAEFAINTRAMENNVYYMAVNRVGVERGFQFIGRSKICDPRGNVLAEAAETDEQILYAEIDAALARDKHLVRVPRLHEIDRFADRRPEMYGPVSTSAEDQS